MANELIEAWRGRESDYTFTLYQTDGLTPANLLVSDIVRFKVGRGDERMLGQEPPLDLGSDENSPLGSSLTFTAGTNIVSLHLAQDETFPWQPGAYNYELLVVDSSDTAKPVQAGVFFLHPTMFGEIGELQSSSM